MPIGAASYGSIYLMGKMMNPNSPISQGTNEQAIGFYVDPNGQALPGKFKEWIGTNMQQERLSQASNLQLQNAIKQLYNFWLNA